MHQNSSSRRTNIATHQLGVGATLCCDGLQLRVNRKLSSIGMDSNFNGLLRIGVTFKDARKPNPKGGMQCDMPTRIGIKCILAVGEIRCHSPWCPHRSLLWFAKVNQRRPRVGWKREGHPWIEAANIVTPQHHILTRDEDGLSCGGGQDMIG